MEKSKEVINDIYSQCHGLDIVYLTFSSWHPYIINSLVFIFQKENWASDSQSSLPKVKLVLFQVIPAPHPWPFTTTFSAIKGVKVFASGTVTVLLLLHFGIWNILYLCFKFIFYWSIVDLQCCVSPWCKQSDSVEYIYSFFIIVYYKILNIVPCAIQ